MSYVDLAEKYLAKRKLAFIDIVKKLEKELKTKVDVGWLYSSLSTDGRFIQLEGNVWDLKNKHKLKEYQLEIDYNDDDEVVFNEENQTETEEDFENNEDDIIEEEFQIEKDE